MKQINMCLRGLPGRHPAQERILELDCDDSFCISLARLWYAALGSNTSLDAAVNVIYTYHQLTSII